MMLPTITSFGCSRSCRDPQVLHQPICVILYMNMGGGGGGGVGKGEGRGERGGGGGGGGVVTEVREK